MALPVEQETQVGSYEKIITIDNRIFTWWQKLLKGSNRFNPYNPMKTP